MFRKTTSLTSTINIAMLCWFLYVLAYVYLNNILKIHQFSAYFILLGEVGLDVVVAMLVLNLRGRAKNWYPRVVYTCFFLSFISSLMADCIYNVVLNLFDFKYANPYVISFFDFPFALFLLFQLAGWILISKENKENKEKTVFSNKSSYIPYVFVSFLMFFMFMFGIPWKIQYLSLVGIFQAIDTILEVLGFAVVTICLARAKTLGMRLIGVGYLVVVSSDFIIRYHIVSGIIPYLSPLEMTWILGLLIISLGFFIIRQDRSDNPFMLLPGGSLQPQVAIWLLILWLVSMLLYAGLYFIFSRNNGDNFNQITQSFVALLVPFSVLIIVSSSYLSKKISSSLTRLENSISNFIEVDGINSGNGKENLLIQYEQSSETFQDKNFELYEVKKLNAFIINTINELRIANRIKSEFLMNMSHDFRTPASGIYHMSRVIYKRLQDQELKKLQELVVNSSEQLMRHLEGVLDFSRLESNMFEINLGDINVKELVNDVIVFLSAKAEEKKLTLLSDFSDHLDIYCGDRLMLQRVLLNVISNAIKFTNDGWVHVSVGYENIDTKKWLLFRIKDTGIGIDQRHHKLIFEPFTCLASPELAKHSGIGLGLSNVNLMLKKMGGRITVESHLNMGATFSIFLPV